MKRGATALFASLAIITAVFFGCVSVLMLLALHIPGIIGGMLSLGVIVLLVVGISRLARRVGLLGARA